MIDEIPNRKENMNFLRLAFICWLSNITTNQWEDFIIFFFFFVVGDSACINQWLNRPIFFSDVLEIFRQVYCPREILNNLSTFILLACSSHYLLSTDSLIRWILQDSLNLLIMSIFVLPTTFPCTFIPFPPKILINK